MTHTRRPAPGIGCDAAGNRTDIRWISDETAAARGLAPQTGDGKFSEWCDFLDVGCEVDLVPFDALSALEAFDGAVCGVTRKERPPGAQPIIRGSWRWGHS